MVDAIFISNAPEDASTAAELAAQLRAAGRDVTISARAGGREQWWASELHEGGNGADVVVVLLSKNSVTSRDVLRDVNLADDENKQIIPVQLDDATPAGGLRYSLSGRPVIDYRTDRAAGARELLDAVGRTHTGNAGRNGSAQFSAAQVSAALAVLQREQEALRPSERLILANRLLNVAVVTWVALFASSFAVSFIDFFLFYRRLGNDAYWNSWWYTSFIEPFTGVFFVLFAVCTIGAGLLFVLNVPLMLKLFRHERVRRGLRVRSYLRFALSSYRRRSREKVFIVLGAVVMSAIVLFAIVILRDPGSYTAVAVLTIPAMGLLVLPGCALIHWGRTRLRFLDRLMTDLETGALPSADDHAVGEISVAEIDTIATLERRQIIEDRRASLRATSEALPAYSLQQSRTVIRAKAELDPATCLRVEQAIQRLVEDPTSIDAAEAGNGDDVRSSLPVPQTGLALEYDVDAESGRIRIFDLLHTGAQMSEGGSGND